MLNTLPRTRTWKRSSRTNHCPICGQRKGDCSFTDDLLTPQVVYCHFVKSDQPAPATSIKESWKHLITTNNVIGDLNPRPLNANNISVDQRTITNNVSNCLTPAQVDKINRRLLELCPLSDQHRQHLESIGLSGAGCGSLVKKEANRIAKLLMWEFGENVVRNHPAVVERSASDGRKWWTISVEENGILFPATNIDGLVLGIQIRKDEPKGSNDRYRWLGHDGLAGTPLTVFPNSQGQNSHLVTITEGYKKAVLGAIMNDCQAVSVAGVDGYKPAELLRTIKALGVTAVALAFDQDKHQNANVQRAEQRMLSLIKTAFPTIQTYYLNWPIEHGKGLDDALLSGKGGFSYDLATVADIAEDQKRFVSGLPGELVGYRFETTNNLHTLAEARAIHRDFFLKLLSEQSDFSQTVITSPTGTGKSTAADNALADLIMTKKLVGRWLLLAPNKANIAERTRPGTALGEALRKEEQNSKNRESVFGTLGGQHKKIAIQQGRELIDLANPKQARSPFDCANPQAQEAGAKRQIAARVICKDCIFGSDANYEKAGLKGPRPFKCEEEGYLHSRKVSEKAQVVIATKESFLNNSEQLDDFDGVIVDEGLLSYLMEVITVDSNVLAGWREKIALKGIEAPEFVQLMEVIESAFDTLAGDPAYAKTEKYTYHEPVEATAPLWGAATLKGYNYPGILEACRLYRNTDKEGTYDFESPYRHNSKTILPFRAARELIDRLNDKTNPARFQRNPDGSFSLVLHQVRRHLVDMLRSKTLVILDATLQPELKKFLLPELEELHVAVPQNVHITQTVNALYSKRDLHNDKTRLAVEQAIDAFVAPGQKNLTIMPLRFEEGEKSIQVPIGTDIGHWGKDERATNQYTDYDSLVLVGHHLRPIPQIRAEVIACRAYAGLDKPEAGEAQSLKLYNAVLPNGSAAGRYMKCDPDLDVQTAIEHDYQANIIQAIGRLRPALRPASAAPARVLLLCNEPVGSLAVQQLATVTEIITYPPKSQLFICNSYMKTGKKRDLVPSYSDIQEGRAALDEDLTQDETPQSQDLDPWDYPDIGQNSVQTTKTTI